MVVVNVRVDLIQPVECAEGTVETLEPVTGNNLFGPYCS